MKCAIHKKPINLRQQQEHLGSSENHLVTTFLSNVHSKEVCRQASFV
jgi:hypothetical protein